MRRLSDFVWLVIIVFILFQWFFSIYGVWKWFDL